MNETLLFRGSLIIGDMAKFYELASWYSLFGIGSFGLGAAISFKRLRITNNPIDNTILKRNLYSAYWLGTGLLMAALASLILVFLSTGNILQYSRSEIFGGIGDTRGFGLFLMTGPSAIILLVNVSSTRIQKYISYTLGILLFLIILLLGYRSAALFSALVGIIIWAKLGRKIKISLAIPMVILVLISIPTVRYLRSMGSYQDISKEKVVESYQQEQTLRIF